MGGAKRIEDLLKTLAATPSLILVYVLENNRWCNFIEMVFELFPFKDNGNPGGWKKRHHKYTENDLSSAPQQPMMCWFWVPGSSELLGGWVEA